MINSILTVCLILFLSSCSSVRVLKGQAGPTGPAIQHDQVDLGLEGTGSSSDVTPVIQPNEETVRLGDRGGDVYSEAEGTEINQSTARKLKIGLSLGPGLYRTFAYVAVLKYLERQSLTPQIITGTGFGAIIAAMYAHGLTPEMIEWNFFRYFREKGNHRPYEEEWYEDIDRLLLEKLKNKKIQYARKKLYLTLYNAKTKKTYYFDKGNTRDLLLKNLFLTTNKKSRTQGTYTAAFEKEIFNPGLMSRLGADFTIGADVLGSKFEFQDSSEFLIGVYGRAAGKISKEKKAFDYFISLPLSLQELDSTSESAASSMKTRDYLEKQTSLIRKAIQQKMNSASAQ